MSEPSFPEIDLVLPCFNEVNSLRWIHQRLPPNFRPIIVDNNSSDGSALIAKSLGMNVVRCAAQGVGSAINTGLKYTKSDIVVVSDCDGTVDPGDLLSLLPPLMHGDVDVIIGGRQYREKHCKPTRFQRALYRIAGASISKTTHLDFVDLGSALAFKRSSFSSQSLEDLDTRSGWSASIVVAASKSGLKVQQAWVPYRCRIGKSKLTGTVSGKFWTSIDIMKQSNRARKSSAP